MNTKIQIFGKYSKTTQIKNLSTCIFLKHRVYVLFWVHVCGFFLMFMLQNPSADALHRKKKRGLALEIDSSSNLFFIEFVVFFFKSN